MQLIMVSITFYLFHLLELFDKLGGNIFYKMQIEMSNFIQVPASLVFGTISEFWISDFLGSPYINW